jgi:uncharacterized membrane protein YhhN
MIRRRRRVSSPRVTSDPERFPSPRELTLLALALGAALAWGAALARGEAEGRYLLAKGATVGLVAVAAFGRRRELPGGALLAAALGAHTAGDLLLERSLLAGVAAFGLGHLGYAILFFRERRPIDALRGGAKLALGLLGLFAAGFVAWLAPRLEGPERVAIPLYVALLAAMAGCAIVCRRGRPLVPLGALAYLASDALLALELFGRGFAAGRALVWPLYVAAQLAVALGWMGASATDEGGAGAGDVAAPD